MGLDRTAEAFDPSARSDGSTSSAGSGALDRGALVHVALNLRGMRGR